MGLSLYLGKQVTLLGEGVILSVGSPCLGRGGQVILSGGGGRSPCRGGVRVRWLVDRPLPRPLNRTTDVENITFPCTWSVITGSHTHVNIYHGGDTLVTNIM